MLLFSFQTSCLQPLIIVANKCDVKKITELSEEDQVGGASFWISHEVSLDQLPSWTTTAAKPEPRLLQVSVLKVVTGSFEQLLTSVFIRKFLLISPLKESPWLRRALWRRRESCKLRLRWGRESLQTCCRPSMCWRWCLCAHGAAFVRPVIASSPLASRQRWRARKSMMFSTDSTWPCPQKGMRR